MTATSSFQIFKLLSIAGQWDKISRPSTRRTFRKADLGFITFSHRSIDGFESGGLLSSSITPTYIWKEAAFS